MMNNLKMKISAAQKVADKKPKKLVKKIKKNKSY